jgi:hypothetical protein
MLLHDALNHLQSRKLASFRWLVATIFLAALLTGSATATAKTKGADAAPLPKNEIQGKASSNYLALSRLHMSVLVDKNRQYRSMELEVWLLPKDEENLALARSNKKAIMANLKDEFGNYDWEAFQDSKKGPEIAKKIVTEVVEHTSGAKLQDVLIKTLLIR